MAYSENWNVKSFSDNTTSNANIIAEITKKQEELMVQMQELREKGLISAGAEVTFKRIRELFSSDPSDNSMLYQFLNEMGIKQRGLEESQPYINKAENLTI